MINSRNKKWKPIAPTAFITCLPMHRTLSQYWCQWISSRISLILRSMRVFLFLYSSFFSSGRFDVANFWLVQSGSSVFWQLVSFHCLPYAKSPDRKCVRRRSICNWSIEHRLWRLRCTENQHAIQPQTEAKCIRHTSVQPIHWLVHKKGSTNKKKMAQKWRISVCAKARWRSKTTIYLWDLVFFSGFLRDEVWFRIFCVIAVQSAFILHGSNGWMNE